MAPPQQGWRLALAILSTSLFIEVLVFSHVAAFVPLYLERELQLAPADVSLWTGLVAGVPLLVALLLAPFWGVWADRYSAKLVMARAQLFELCVYVGMVFAASLSQFVIASLLLGLTFGNIAVLMAVVAKLTPRHRVGFAISFVQAILPLGSSLGPLFGSVLIPLIGLRGMFAVDAGLVIVSALVLLIGLREPPRIEQTNTMLEQMRQTAGQAWSISPVRWSFAAMFFLIVGQTLVQPYIPIFLGRYYSGSDLDRAIGIVLGTAGLATAVITPIIGILGDRFGHERMALPAFGILSVLHVLLFVVSGPVALVGLLLLRTVPFASTMGTLNTSLAIRSPVANRAALISLAPFPRNLAMFVGPSLAAVVSRYSLDLLFPLAAISLLGGAAMAWLLNRSARDQDAADARGHG